MNENKQAILIGATGGISMIAFATMIILLTMSLIAFAPNPITGNVAGIICIVLIGATYVLGKITFAACDYVIDRYIYTVGGNDEETN